MATRCGSGDAAGIGKESVMQPANESGNEVANGTAVNRSAYARVEGHPMRRFALFALVLGVVVAYGLLPESHETQVRAAGQNASACDDEDHGDWGGRAKVCEKRSQTLTLGGSRLAIDTTNGGIEVIGESRKDVAME